MQICKSTFIVWRMMGVCERNDFTGRWVDPQADTRSGSFQSQRFEYTNENAWVSFLIFKPRHIFSLYFLTLVVKISLHSHTNTRECTHTHTHTHKGTQLLTKQLQQYIVSFWKQQSLPSARVSRLEETTNKFFCNHLISTSDKLVYNYYS